MSQHKDNVFKALVTIYLLILTAAIMLTSEADRSELRDLQRRVGQLESRR